METKTNELYKHYTKLENLEKILRGGKLKFSSPRNWRDKNDQCSVLRYQELMHMTNDVLVLCLCDGEGSIYHWNDFGMIGEENIHCWNLGQLTCSIEINKQKFIEHITSEQRISKITLPHSVLYKSFQDPISIDELPYVKRLEYQTEKEVRILYTGIDSSYYLPLPFDCIERIGVGDCSQRLFKKARKRIVNAGLPAGISIEQYCVENSRRWRDKINGIIN